MDSDRPQHLTQFTRLYYEYANYIKTCLLHFGHSLHHSSQAYIYIQTIRKDAALTWEVLRKAFEKMSLI